MTAWTDFCKAYAAEHKISYKQAMKDASASYKSVGKPPVVEEIKEEAKVEPVEAKVEGDSVEVKPPQIKHKRAPKKVKDAFLLNVEEILKTESEKEKKVKKA